MIEIKDLSVDSLQCTVTFVYEDQQTDNSILKQLKEKEVFEGKSGQVFYRTTEVLNYEIYVGLGKYEELDREDFVTAVAKGMKQAEKLNVNSLGINFIKAKGLCTGGVTKAIVEGVKLSGYKFSKYNKGKENFNPQVAILCYWQVLLEKFRQIILLRFFHFLFSKILILDVQAYSFCHSC